MSISESTRELVNLCRQAPQEINGLLPYPIKIELIRVVALHAFERKWKSINPFINKLATSPLITTKDLREVTRLYLQRCPKNAIFSLLGLHAWATKGNKQEACRRIINCLVNSDVKLNLTDLQLSTLPNAIGHLSHLEVLLCYNNQLVSLPETIGQLSNLQELQCWNNQLTSLPEAIGQLVNLRLLYCSNNLLTSLPETICQLSNLRELEFWNNGFTTLPEVITQLSNLEVLDCSNNQLVSLPETIGQLSNLQELQCWNNPFITPLPETIGQLSNLRRLDCSDNQLTRLPEAIGQLSHLEWLYATGNPAITNLPLGIFNLSLNCIIELTNTTLSPSLLETLEERSRNGNYIGPVIHYSIGEDVVEEEKSVDELLNALYANLEHPVPKELAILSKDANQAKSFRSWLNRLSWTADGQSNSKKGFYAAIADLLKFAADNESYRALFHAILLEASKTCGDKVTLSIIQLEIAKQEITIDKTNLPALADFLKRGHLAMQRLQEIAYNKTSILSMFKIKFDEVEIYLAYPIQLKEALNLPFSTEKMHFMCCSRVTTEDLKLAQELVEAELNNQDAVVDFLIENNIWMEALKGRFPEKFKTIQQNLIEKEQNPADAYRALTFEALKVVA